jgi:galactokinase/CTP:molybdopterin cytidylyltransferase MocA
LKNVHRDDLKSVVSGLRGVRLLDALLPDGEQISDLATRSILINLAQTYGSDPNALSHQLRRISNLAQRFTELYGGGPVILLRAPARINILGEHVDYVSYLPTQSLPFGSREHDMLMLVRVAEGDLVRGASTRDDYPNFSFPLLDGPGSVRSNEVNSDWLSYLVEHSASAPHWSNYVKGPAYLSRLQFGEKLARGIDFVIDSEIPAGGGASSSSALVVLANAALRRVNGIISTPLELALDSSKAEWYVGTRGGAMDHLTICLARADHAVLISFANQQADQISLPGDDYRWVTFFSQPADKGREVMIEYNERAAISRVVLPVLVDRWKQTRPDLYERWQLSTRSLLDLDEVEQLIAELPERLSLTELSRDYPAAFSQCAKSFPALIAERIDRPLKIRARALHHLGEIRRVNTATMVLKEFAEPGARDNAMRELGKLLDQSHVSLRDLYEVSTAEVERLVDIIRNAPGVYGARLMGGGFGGNVLALTTEATIDSLIKRVQNEYYEPAGRHGVNEGSVMISTPGDGLAAFETENLWREVINDFNSGPQYGETIRTQINRALDFLPAAADELDVWPIVVAAGRGSRSLASGLAIPKPIAPILGRPAIGHVLKNIRDTLGAARPPIVIVSPETEREIRECLEGEAIIVVQPEALGTGDAVLCAQPHLEQFTGRALVIWGTQPVIQAKTITRTLKLASLFNEYPMVLPTAYKLLPYAPVLRNTNGNVVSASETHLEKAEQIATGETNIGMFVLKSCAMFEALNHLKEKYWNESERNYNRRGGELGFPNELINYFGASERGVFACPIADSREEQGIKTLSDVERCEQFLIELSAGGALSNAQS